MAVKDWRFSRPTLLNACLIQEVSGHAWFDFLLVELGLTSAIRSGGGLKAKANALTAFVLENPDRLVGGDVSLAVVIVQHALQLDPRPDRVPRGIKDSVHNGFWKSLSEDGYTVVDGQLGRASSKLVTRSAPGQLHEHDAETEPNYLRGAVRASPSAQEKWSVELTDPHPPPAPARLRKQVRQPGSRPRVFVVHGRDNGLKHEVARFLEKLGLEPVILHERPNEGRTLLSKFQEESEDVRFAVVLMTPDDVGGLAGGKQQRPRARQNVVFELGFFIGRLGPQSVCALVSGELERPSDFDAVMYVKYESTGAWKNEVARELNNAGIEFDAKALIR
jgi:predicted nucleotide-binding protein